MTGHTRTPTGDKPFECQICHRSYTTKSILLWHMKRHTGEKPHKCDLCPMRFLNRIGLHKHVISRVTKLKKIF